MIRLRLVLWLDAAALFLALALPAPRWMMVILSLALMYTLAGAIHYTRRRAIKYSGADLKQGRA